MNERDIGPYKTTQCSVFDKYSICRSIQALTWRSCWFTDVIWHLVRRAGRFELFTARVLCRVLRYSAG